MGIIFIACHEFHFVYSWHVPGEERGKVEGGGGERRKGEERGKERRRGRRGKGRGGKVRGAGNEICGCVNHIPIDINVNCGL